MATDDPPGDFPDNARTRVVDHGAPLALTAGTLLGRYRIDGVLGQGGFGITYRATDTALGRAVAIKEYLPGDVAIRIDGTTVIPRSRTDADDYEWGLRRFLEEAKTLAQHEAVSNVVRVYDFIEANGTAYMVMALVEGDSLATILRQRPTLGEDEIRGLALPLLDGLEQLHAAGLIHRDIKPANIILRAGREPTLIDFGAAREGLGRRSRSVTSILTPGYAPFEQYGSAGDQGPWTDIYALAATLYHGITGRPPPDSVDRIRRDPMVPAAQAGAGRYSADLLAAIDAGLRVDERERPQSAAAWRSMFGAVARPAVTAFAPPPQTTTGPSVAPPSPAPVLDSPAKPPRRSPRGPIAAGLAMLMIAGGGAVAWQFTSGRPQADPPRVALPDPAATKATAAEKERLAALEKELAAAAAARQRLESQVAEAESRRKAEDEARRKAAEEARLRAEAEARAAAEAEDRRRIEQETRARVEAEFKARADAEARQRQLDEEARRKAEEARQKAADSERRAEEARKRAEAAAQRVAGAQPKSAATPPTPQVATAPAATVDPAAYVAQHWPALRVVVAAHLRSRGPTVNPITGWSARFASIESYHAESVTPAEIVLRIVYATDTQRGGTMVSLMRIRNQPSDFTVIAATDALRPPLLPSEATSPSPQIAATPAAVADPAAYVANHWPVMRTQIEMALRERGVVTDVHTGTPMKLQSVNGYAVVAISAAAVVLRVNYTNVRLVSGGLYTGSWASLSETATFANQPPNFPLQSLK